jgi:aldose 1-epimerase
MPSPSGRQFRLVHGDQEANVVELGAGLRTYTVGGRPVLDGYGSEEICAGGRGQALIPWPNRLGDGCFEWDGQKLQTALTEPAQHNAIHGLVRWAPWTVAEQESARVRLTYRLYPQPGWPWIIDLAVAYSLSEQGLQIHTTAVNLPGGAGTCPFGVGWHPYLYAFGGLVDDAVLAFDAATTYVCDERGLPASTAPVPDSMVDFSGGRKIGSAQLDQAYTDLGRDAMGRASVDLVSSQGREQSIRLWMDSAYTHLMVFSGDTLADPDRRRRGLAVEPMTGAPDMFRNGFGTIVLEEGDTFEASWGLVASGEAAS